MMKKLKKMVCRMLLCCGILAGMLLQAGCGSQTDTAPAEESLDLTALSESMIAADTTLPEMTVVTDADEQAELNFGAFSDFDYARVQSYFYAYATDGSTQEIAVVELSDTADAAALMNSMQKHLEDRRGTLSTYAPDQLSMVEHAVIKQDGRYIAMIICEKSGLVQQAFLER